MNDSRTAEVAIVGGGIVGASLALSLAQAGRIAPARIVVIEPAAPVAPSPDAPVGLRVSAITPANRARFQQQGVWQRLQAARICPYERMRVWHESLPPDSPDVLVFDAAEVGEPDLGCIVENAALQAALLDVCAGRGIRILPATLQAMQVDADGVSLQLGGASLRAELAVGADGANSAARRWLAMPTTQHDYQQRAIVASVQPAKPHAHTAWQRFLATGPLALLPLPGNLLSIVWSVTETRAAELLAMPPEQFNAALTVASAGVLGELTLAGERAAFALRRMAVDRYVQPRIALVGDAAHVIHPLAGQGVNQGLEDAASLAVHLARRPAGERWCTGRAAGLPARAPCAERAGRWSGGWPGPVVYPAARRGDARGARRHGAAGAPAARPSGAGQASGIWSILAAQMKSFSDRPPMACVV